MHADVLFLCLIVLLIVLFIEMDLDDLDEDEIIQKHKKEMKEDQKMLESNKSDKDKFHIEL